MKDEDRRAAVATYKERKVVAGIYAVRCATSGEIWAGAAPDLSTIQNRLWFTLRQRCNPHPSLQQAWTDHGGESFAFEIVERLADEEISYVLSRLLKARLGYWADRLGAARI